MEIHCSFCDRVESIDGRDIPLKKTSGDVPVDASLHEGLIPHGEAPASIERGIPYELEDIKKAINEQLPAWEADIIRTELTTSLEITCPAHLQQENLNKLTKLVEDHLQKVQTQDETLYVVIKALYKQHGYANLLKTLNTIHKNL